MALVGVPIVAALVAPRLASKRPPLLGLVRAEPAGIFDDNGEMSLVTVCMTYPQSPQQPEDALVVKGSENSVQARVDGRWVGVKGALVFHGNNECELLFPAGADVCRLSMQYTGRTRVFKKHPIKGRLEWLAEQLPPSVRSRFSYKFWRWVGFPEHGPSSDWRTISVELPLASPSTPAFAPTGAHNPPAGVDGGIASPFALLCLWPAATQQAC
jgi:hypothetical protein